MNTKDKANIAESKVISDLIASGYTVLIPFGDNERYDVVAEKDGCFVRIQVKTGRIKNGTIKAKVCSSQAHRGKSHQHYHGQVEYICIYEPTSKNTYMIPIEECGTSEISLRTEQPKKHTKQIRWAKQYLFSFDNKHGHI